MEKVTQIKFMDDLLLAVYHNRLFVIDVLPHQGDWINITQNRTNRLHKLFKIEKFGHQYNFKVMDESVVSFECYDLMELNYQFSYLTTKGELYVAGRNDHCQINKSGQDYDVDGTLVCNNVESFSYSDEQLFVLLKNGDVYTRGGRYNIQDNNNFQDLTKIYSGTAKIVSNGNRLIILTKCNKLVLMYFKHKTPYVKEVQMDTPVTHLNLSNTLSYPTFIQDGQLKMSLYLFVPAIQSEWSAVTLTPADSMDSKGNYFHHNDKLCLYNWFSHFFFEKKEVVVIDNYDTMCGYDTMCNYNSYFFTRQSKIMVADAESEEPAVEKLNIAWSPANHHRYPKLVNQIVWIMMVVRYILTVVNIKIDRYLFYQLIQLCI